VEGKHPLGMIGNVIGIVNQLSNFYEYQLYCKNLHISLSSFNTEIIRSINKKSEEQLINEIINDYSNIIDRTYYNIFSIDPSDCTDYDDAFSIVKLSSDITQLSIYIANVPIWLDYLNLWQYFTERISTIYLPDKKRPMIPSILSDCLCSLCEKKKRIAFAIDLFIQDNKIINIQYSNCVIIVKKNFCYEEQELLTNPDYNNLFEIVSQVSLSSKFNINIKNSIINHKINKNEAKFHLIHICPYLIFNNFE
jgi:exoribonuclease R